MERRVIFTRRADKKFDAIIDYFDVKFGLQVAKRFVNRTYSFFEIVRKFPEIGMVEDESKGIYGFVLEKQVTVFYRFTQKELIILNFYDTRMNPSKRV